MSATRSTQSPLDIYVAILPPPASLLKTYDLSLPATQQPSSASIPQIFIDTASIREAIFVREQGLVALEHHINAEDGRAWHFVAYVDDDCNHEDEGSEGEKIKRTPIGTLRVLPPPHHAHPEPGIVVITPKPGEVVAPTAEELFGEVMERVVQKGQQEMRKTSLHDGREGWLQVARASVLKEWRGKGVADMLVAEVVRWAEGEYSVIEGRRKATEGGIGEWKGLLMCNARQEAKGMWERNGFEEDVGMGRWIEVGVELFGMGRRVGIENLIEDGSVKRIK